MTENQIRERMQQHGLTRAKITEEDIDHRPKVRCRLYRGDEVVANAYSDERDDAIKLAFLKLSRPQRDTPAESTPQ